MQDIMIFGSGGLAREVAFLIEDINRVSPSWNILGFVTNDKKQVGLQIGKYSIICTEYELSNKNVGAVIGIANPVIIKKIAEHLSNYSNIFFPNLVHPSTILDEDRIFMGEGNIISAGNIFTTDIKIGSFNYFNLNCTYGHDIQIANYCVFNPGINLSGGVTIGSCCLIGTGATILQYLNINDYVTVGAGAVVTKDVHTGLTVIGIPANPLIK